jgi:hypothetical protein
MKSLGLLIAGTLAVWAAAAYPARLLWGESAVLLSATAGLLCLVPTAATLVWSQRAFHKAPQWQLVAVLGGTCVRMLFVVGAGLALFMLVPEFQYQRFWVWLVAFYLVTLTLEVVLITRGVAAGQPQKN